MKIGKFITIQLIIIIGLLEMIGRFFDPLGISYYPEMAKYLDTMIIEEPIGYRNRPHLHGNFFGTQVIINSLGMRDREVGTPVANELRILVLGDSVPFGVGVQYENSFPYQLEQILNTNTLFKGPFRTLNMGVPSYNTEQELLQLQTLGMALQPNVVILLFVRNDIEPKMWVFDKRQTWYANLAQRSYSASLLFVFYFAMKNSLAGITIFSNSGLIPVAHAGEPIDNYHPNREQWQVIDKSLTVMNRLLSSRRIPFVVFTYQEAPPIFNLVQQVGNREGFPVINLMLWQDPRWSHQGSSNYVNSYVDQHPNSTGHLILATLIAEQLTQLNILGLAATKEESIR